MNAKDRITLYVATNSMGSQKVPLVMIGSSKNPRCFGQNLKKVKFKYFNQKKAWSDTQTYTRWFFKAFLPHVCSKTNDKVPLIMDNCGPHGAAISDPLGQVRIATLPPNCTAVHQPMDMSIIAALKGGYQYKLLNQILESIEHCK